MRYRLSYILPVVVVLILVRPAAAQYTWTGANSSPTVINDPVDWSNPFNWQGSAIPASASNTTITFATAPAGVSNNNLAPYTVNQLSFYPSMALSGSPLTLSNGLISQYSSALAINNNLVLAGPTLVVGASGTLDLNGSISGSGALVFGASNGGDTNFVYRLHNASNSYSGGTKIGTNGVVRLDSSTGGLPSGGDVSIYEGFLDLNGFTPTIGNLQLASPNLGGTPVVAEIYGSFHVTGNVTYSPNHSVSTPGAIISGSSMILDGANPTISVDHGISSDVYDLSIPAQILGNNGFTKTGTGTLALSGPVGTIGPVTINSGTVQLLKSNIMSPPAIVNGGLFQLGQYVGVGVGTTFTSYNQSIGYLSGTGGIVDLLGATLTVGVYGTSTSYSGSLYAQGGTLVKAGAGTFTLNCDSTNFQGSITVANGVLAVSGDNNLGNAGRTLANTLTVNAAGTLLYTASATTSRTLNLTGTLEAPAGVTLTLSQAAVNGGFIHGVGTIVVTGGTTLSGVTTYGNVTLNQTGAGTFVNFTNGGALNVSAGSATPSTFSGFTNQGSGAITIGASSKINAAEFQTYGMLTLANGTGSTNTLMTNTGTSPMYFNGGSQTFIGTAGGNKQAQLELNGQNAIVAGGLLVNNGHVTDSSAAGISTIIADYGALVKGAGQYDNSPQTQNGGKFQAGNSPGVATVGRFVFGPGGVSNYVFAINDATGTAGPTPDAMGHVSGWGLVKTAIWQRAAGMTSGDFVWTADASHPLTVAIDTLVNPTTVGIDIPGLMADFDPSRSYSWAAEQWAGTYSGPTDVAALDAATNFDTSAFANPITGTFGWSLDPAGNALSLTYSPSAVPEPGTLVLVGFAATALACWRRRRQVETTAS